MFKKNRHHVQLALISNVNDLPEKQRKRLETSWASVFYREFFCRLDEEPFCVLYVDIPSRPNVPVNVLVGLEYLKSGFGWSDEEMHDAFTYNVQVRYALGYHNLGEGDFDIRTLYYFRQRLSRYMQEQGINLLDQAFAQVTDEQIEAFKLKTGKQRMDSTQVASNIRKMGRLQLLVEVLQRAHRMLSESDQTHYAQAFEPYLKGHAGQYVYRIKGEDTSRHLHSIGEFMHNLLAELRDRYATEPEYQVLERVFSEHFRVEEQEVQTKTGKELSASSLQSPDDLEATYREKGGCSHRGYVNNLTETCDPENPLQLITKVQVEPNNTDDAQMLIDAVADLKKRTDLDTFYTDGVYSSPQADQVLNEHQVTQIQTAIRGRTPNPEKLHLSDFEIKQNQRGKPVQITCPQGQHVPVHTGSKKKGFVAHFDPRTCQQCPFYQAEKCPAKPGKRDQRHRLYFSLSQAHVAQRRRRSLAHQKEGRNLRAAVEATMRLVKHPFPAGKLPVRGQFRMTCMLIGSAAMINVRRIQRFLDDKNRQEKQKNEVQKEQKRAHERQSVLLFASVKTFIEHWVMPMRPQKLCFGC